jgi:purine-nucleoside phosphorylase
MSTHIGAKTGDIAETILLPGDPLRAQFVAETYLENPVCYNKVRGMLGFTGTYKGKRLSVQGTGMGQPSLAIYANELIRDYGVSTLIRVGTCGGLQASVKVRDIVIAMSASTDSAANRIRFRGMDYAPTADFGLIMKAYAACKAASIEPHVGPVVSSDAFYTEDPDQWKMWARYGTLAVEMESAELFTLAAKYGKRAVAILTVSDSLVSGVETSAEERQTAFLAMIEAALATAVAG